MNDEKVTMRVRLTFIEECLANPTVERKSYDFHHPEPLRNSDGVEVIEHSFPRMSK